MKNVIGAAVCCSVFIIALAITLEAVLYFGFGFFSTGIVWLAAVSLPVIIGGVCLKSFTDREWGAKAFNTEEDPPKFDPQREPEKRLEYGSNCGWENSGQENRDQENCDQENCDQENGGQEKDGQRNDCLPQKEAENKEPDKEERISGTIANNPVEEEPLPPFGAPKDLQETLIEAYKNGTAIKTGVSKKKLNLLAEMKTKVLEARQIGIDTLEITNSSNNLFEAYEDFLLPKEKYCGKTYQKIQRNVKEERINFLFDLEPERPEPDMYLVEVIPARIRKSSKQMAEISERYQLAERGKFIFQRDLKGEV